jgi:hypothetical protein
MAKITKTLPIGTAVFPKLDKVDVYQPKNAKTGKNTARRSALGIPASSSLTRITARWMRG